MKIEWIGDHRFTKWGEGIKGNVLDLPDHVAKSFIEQGLAKDPKPKKETKVEGN